MREWRYKLFDYLRELICWQLFFLIGVAETVMSLGMLATRGGAVDVIFFYSGLMLIGFSIWLRQQEKTDGRAFSGLPRWFNWALAAINLPMGIIVVREGSIATGLLLIVASILMAIAAFFKGGDDKGDGGDDGPKRDDPNPSGEAKPLDWVLKGRPRMPVNVSDN